MLVVLLGAALSAAASGFRSGRDCCEEAVSGRGHPAVAGHAGNPAGKDVLDRPIWRGKGGTA